MKKRIAKRSSLLAIAMLLIIPFSPTIGKNIQSNADSKISAECRNDVCCYFFDDGSFVCSGAPIISV